MAAGVVNFVIEINDIKLKHQKHTRKANLKELRMRPLNWHMLVFLNVLLYTYLFFVISTHFRCFSHYIRYNLFMFFLMIDSFLWSSAVTHYCWSVKRSNLKSKKYINANNVKIWVSTNNWWNRKYKIVVPFTEFYVDNIRRRHFFQKNRPLIIYEWKW